MQAGYEDVWYYLWRERQLPVNVDPFDARLDDELERDRLRHVFTQGLDAVVGYALPIRRVGGRDGPWATGRGSCAASGSICFPATRRWDSGCRSIRCRGSAPGDVLTIDELDPFAPRPPLPVAGRRGDGPHRRSDGPSRVQAWVWWLPDPAQQSRVGLGDARPAEAVTGRPPSRGNRPPESSVRRCASSRAAACLYIFMPPVKAVEDYLDLVGRHRSDVASARHARAARRLSAAERSAAGAFPRHAGSGRDRGERAAGPQLGSARRADDGALRGREAQAGLAPEKFMLDGRHTGTGGGNHFVLGGSTPADSPFLRRPDLLRSLITYWHNHPSLSYLFSGLFLGPTSQAPRIDEGRHDSLYEIEIAFSRFAPPDRPTPPWFVDRALRHLLVDVTGNTHRAEFCIDKLYSPDVSSGRRGLLELRAFEMPPDARMSVAQQLLLRALIARFWREPYAAGLMRWGTELHDRFMLPYFIALDFDDVIEELRRAGYPLSSDWFAPHLEFRFPLAGELSARAIHLTLRQALEPWHVLGEEGGGRRHGAVRRFIPRAPAAARHRADRRSLRDHVQRPAAAAAADGAQRRVRRRRPLPRLAAAVGASPDDSGPRAAHVRHRRHLDGAVGRRLPVSRDAPRRTQLRSVPGEQLRGREPAARAIHASRPHAGARARRPSGAEPGVSLHAGPANLP